MVWNKRTQKYWETDEVEVQQETTNSLKLDLQQFA